ncbi:aspartoacylase [Cyanobium sp. NIES-981]|uniref:aspartoacylase n=1 Tax=Cyanobium sp. NIES-981 TaxID=1851505 RepID=UPI0007DD2122|nr:aspartoacylase [Cyanobium sp. NIES-981]SBO44643.1 putative aspartoacylase [Cyanobium sp. NIES-981]
MERLNGVLVVGGTHGNERNAPWLLEHWRQEPARLRSAALHPVFVLGNPQAWASNQRYVERDLNRCFSEALLQHRGEQALEVRRARQLLEEHGPGGREPCAVAIDLHSTTSAMGSCLVLYGRRFTDLALAAGIQARLGLPVYLHEGDPAQTGFLVERWPCGVVIEVGPVPQGVVQARICRQTQLALEAALAVLSEARGGPPRLPAALVVHRHLRSLDLPRRPDGDPLACIHPRLQSRDWWPLPPGAPLFLDPDGRVIGFESSPDAEPQVAVFINEAAYGEKGIALSLTRREAWPVLPAWSAALQACAATLTTT